MYVPSKGGMIHTGMKLKRWPWIQMHALAIVQTTIASKIDLMTMTTEKGGDIQKVHRFHHRLLKGRLPDSNYQA